MAVSQNGYPANNRSLVHNPTVPGTGIDFPGGIRKGAVTTVMLYVALQWHRRIEALRDGWCWGYAERAIRGSSTTSNHCLTGDTRIVTHDGAVPLAELTGATATLLVRDPAAGSDRGRWVDAPVSSFGREHTHRIVMSRVGVRREIRATASHRWFVQRKTSEYVGDYRSEYRVATDQRSTTELEPGDRLATCLPGSAGGFNRLTPSPFGVAHGLVYGDGTVQPSGPRSGDTTKVTLWNEKIDLLGWFPAQCPTSPRERDTGARGVEVRGLPCHYKTLPSLTESSTYLAGWLAGYFAADGNVQPDEITISSRDRDALEFVQVVASRLGIACREPRVQKVSGGYKPADQWSVSFLRDTVPDWMVLRAVHQDRLGDLRSRGRAPGWKVDSVEPTGDVEDVYCATVDGPGAFTLEGWVLTGNSSGTAGDGNAPEHPLGVRSTFTARQREILREIEAEVEHVVRFGEFYSGRVDGMHWEINAPLAAVERVAGRLLAGGAAPPMPRPTLRRGDSGHDVRELQTMLTIEVDGDFGPTTEAAVFAFQRAHRLEADGVCGPATWAALEDDVSWTEQIPDPYRVAKGEQGATWAARDALAWAATHPAYAREEQAAQHAQLSGKIDGLIAAVANIGGIDPDLVRQAVETGTVTAISEVVPAVLGQVLAEKLGEDNAALAAEIVEALGERLATGGPSQ